jgi:hypothetical protein
MYDSAPTARFDVHMSVKMVAALPVPGAGGKTGQRLKKTAPPFALRRDMRAVTH